MGWSWNKYIYVGIAKYGRQVDLLLLRNVYSFCEMSMLIRELVCESWCLDKSKCKWKKEKKMKFLFC